MVALGRILRKERWSDVWSTSHRRNDCLDKGSKLRRDGKEVCYRSWKIVFDGECKRKIFLNFPLKYKN